MSTTVVIADDHAIVRDGLRALLEVVPDVDVVGEADSGPALIALVEQLRPTVVIADVEMPGGGVAATREIVQRWPEVRVLVLTMHDDGPTLMGALRAGARGYVVKGAGRDEVVHAVTAVARGEVVLGSGVADWALTAVTGGPQAAQVFPQLTPREHEVLDLMAAGMDNDEIRQRLGLTLKTVRNNVASVFTKLQVSDRTRAVVMAREAGLGGSRSEH